MPPAKASRPGRSLLAFAVILLLLYGGMAAAATLGKGSWTPKLGLDLEGGTSVTLIPKPEPGKKITDDAIQQAIDIMRNRVNGSGVAEAEVVAQGTGQQRSIVVSLPGERNPQLVQQLQQAAQLRFRPVLQEQVSAPQPTATPSASASPSGSAQPSATPSASASPGATLKAPSASASPTSSSNGRPAPRAVTPSPSATASGSTASGSTASGSATPAPPASGSAAPSASATTDASGLAGVPQSLIAQFNALDCSQPNERPRDVAADKPMIACDESGQVKYLLGPADIVGTDLSGASAGLETTSTGATTGAWEVQLTFDSTGAKKFTQSTTKLAQQAPPQNQFAIVLDGQVISAPSVSAPIPGGSARITGNFTQATATSLANVLKYGALPLTFQAGDVEEISPTLGSDSLQGGLIAGAIGLGLVVLYSLIYYRGLGLVSLLSLVAAAAVTYASVVLLGDRIGFALTLAGVAGAIVAVGITADSFVVYFERVRDELRDGRTLRVAVESGWNRARRTILAADFVSFLAAVILYILSVGSVRGFAFTLGLTTLIDVLVVFIFTKPFLTLLARTSFYGKGHRLSGLAAERVGGKAAARAAVATAGGSGSSIVARRAAASGSSGSTAVTVPDSSPRGTEEA
ncbi:MAG: protein translocase subunit SecD [Actinomycetes bacterium]